MLQSNLTKKQGGMHLDQDWMVLYQRRSQLAALIAANQETEKFGLTLSEEDAQMIVQECGRALREQRRVEFGTGIMPKIIYEFCDSDFIDRNNYVDTLIRLQEIFYLYKNEMHDEITDDELLHFMKEQYENVCYGDLDYLEGTCLNIFAQAIRAGYNGYRDSEGRGIYGGLSEVPGWDYELYVKALEDFD